MLQPNYLKEFISSDVTPFIIILTLLCFIPISIVVVCVHHIVLYISSMLFKWFPSDTRSELGLRVSEQALLLYNCKYVRRVSILLARDFFYHSAFQQVGSVSSNISAYCNDDFAVLSVYPGIVISTIQLFCCEPAAA